MLGVGRYGPCGRMALGPAAGSPVRETPPGPVGRSSPDAVDDVERDAWVVLDSVTGVGPVSFARLLATFGTAAEVLRSAVRRGGVAALVTAAVDPAGGSSTLSAATARAIADAADEADRRLEVVRRAGLSVVVLADGGYPSRLRLIELPPPVLYVRGAADALDRERAVAIVGTRRPTEVGRFTAGRIADSVASLGATIVSGLALGIDAAAHESAVANGTPTVAVIGGGHAHLYPAGHRRLVARIEAAGGAVVSEFGPDTVPSRGTFPRRNRIISGLSDATIVVEAGIRSGALTTAAWALEQGRGLHIVPGRLGDPAVAGSLAFLREAGPEARIVAGIPELIEDLTALRAWQQVGSDHGGVAGARSISGEGAQAAATRSRSLLGALPVAERVIALEIAAGRSGVDELVAVTGLGGATVLGALTALELRGLVIEAFGRYRPAGALATAGDRPRKPSARAPRPAGRVGPGGRATEDAA